MGLHTIFQETGFHPALPLMFLYIGPETMLPLASALTAILGVLLMFWQRVVGLLRKFWRIIVRK
jgi:hypothetical protein